jgi:hypothetical protein
MRREIQYGRCRLQLKRRLGVATPFRLVLVIEGPDARPADLSTELLNVCDSLVYRFVARKGRVCQGSTALLRSCSTPFRHWQRPSRFLLVRTLLPSCINGFAGQREQICFRFSRCKLPNNLVFCLIPALRQCHSRSTNEAGSSCGRARADRQDMLSPTLMTRPTSTNSESTQ